MSARKFRTSPMLNLAPPNNFGELLRVDIRYTGGNRKPVIVEL